MPDFTALFAIFAPERFTFHPKMELSRSLTYMWTSASLLTGS